MEQRPQDVAETGISGLDDILAGGLPRNRIYLLQGEPGVGKTTVALQFLLEGVRRKEPVLYITLSETAEEIHAVAAGHGWNLDGVTIQELSSVETKFDALSENTLFHPSEVELQETTNILLAEIDRVKPTRVAIDSLSELRLLAQSALRYRRQILALKQYFTGRKSTVLLLDDKTSETGDLQLESLAHGVVSLEQLAQTYGVERRRVRITKLRGVKFRGGFHDYRIATGGVKVFPRLIASEHREPRPLEDLPSGNAGLDTLLHGGLHRGTTTLLTGPAGSGKSALSTSFVVAAAKRGERAVIFAFEEGMATLITRSAALGMDLRPHIADGSVLVKPIDPAELTPGEFTHIVRAEVEEHDARVVIIDSLNGYMNAMPDERFLTLQIRELLSYLNQRGVATILVLAQHGMLGSSMKAPIDVSYLADTVILLRYFEAAGAIHKAISVVKKRSGPHEDTIREYGLGAGGIRIGEPLKGFQGVLTGVPTFAGTSATLMTEKGKPGADGG